MVIAPACCLLERGEEMHALVRWSAAGAMAVPFCRLVRFTHPPSLPTKFQVAFVHAEAGSRRQ